MLEGYQVVEAASFVAGPAAAGILADWGAEVVKIEPKSGDPIRWNRPPGREGGSSPNFEFDNRGKRSIALDYSTPEGWEVIRRLIERADVFVTSLRPGALARAKMDYAMLSAINPRLVYASITGYGLNGDLADAAAFDVVAFWARSGLNGEMMAPGEEPPPGRPGVGDHVTALTAALGIVTALLARTKSGRGQLVESSLLRAATYIGGYDLAEHLRRGETLPARAPERTSRLNMNYAAKDGRWFAVFAFDPERDWPKIFAVAGEPGLADDERFASQELRTANAAALTRILDTAFAKLTIDEIGARLTAAGMIWSPVSRMADVANDPVARDAGCFVETVDVDGGRFLSPAPPVRFPAYDGNLMGAVPRVGEHSDAVLAALGYGPEAVERLRGAAIVG